MDEKNNYGGGYDTSRHANDAQFATKSVHVQSREEAIAKFGGEARWQDGMIVDGVGEPLGKLNGGTNGFELEPTDRGREILDGRGAW